MELIFLCSDQPTIESVENHEEQRIKKDMPYTPLLFSLWPQILDTSCI
jgi:hypothetical protein